jgi:uncharacterized flavoprotein (TIGR03862 family)
MAAEVLATGGVSVTVYERMPSVGRKLLLAGRGGLNLTHTEPLDAFLARYGPARAWLQAAIEEFGPDALRAWCAGLGQEPFVGSSGRVFPSGFRATPLLRAWLARLATLDVTLRTRHEWWGFDDESVGADALVLALGGASWPRTGSNGAWTSVVDAAGIAVAPLRPANCGFAVEWTSVFRERFAGVPLKNVAVSFEGATARGDVMITDTGIEGAAVYALSVALRAAIDARGGAELTVDLRPDLSSAELRERLARGRRKDSASTALGRVGVAPVAIGLLREATGGRLPADVAALVKALPLTLDATELIDRAISTAGGIALDEVDDTFMLRRRPGTFVAGEMLDWEAPTGGYLLQACFATAVAAAEGVLAWLASRRPD